MASHEVYVPPVATGSSQTTTAGTTAGTTASSAFRTAVDDGGPTTQYLCGECNQKVQLKKGDPIRCKDCGHRVLYKERTKRMVQFEAR